MDGHPVVSHGLHGRPPCPVPARWSCWQASGWPKGAPGTVTWLSGSRRRLPGLDGYKLRTSPSSSLVHAACSSLRECVRHPGWQRSFSERWGRSPARTRARWKSCSRWLWTKGKHGLPGQGTGTVSSGKQDSYRPQSAYYLGTADLTRVISWDPLAAWGSCCWCHQRPHFTEGEPGTPRGVQGTAGRRHTWGKHGNSDSITRPLNAKLSWNPQAPPGLKTFQWPAGSLVDNTSPISFHLSGVYMCQEQSKARYNLHFM